jgi:anti-repressor protein
MNDIQIFNHPQFGAIRTTGTPDAPEFCAMDLCKALGYSNGRKAISDHCDAEDVTKCYTLTNGGRQELTYVSESGMYSLVIASKLPQAKQFKHWVTSEVLPSIRKTGSYSVEQLSRKQLALMVVQAEEEKERLALENKHQQEQLEEQKPKVAFADAVLSSPDSILIGELAKILCQNGYKTGEIRLYDQLRREGYLCSAGSDYNLPMQRYLEMGLFEVTKGTRSGNGGVQHITRTTKITPKGQQYFINKFVTKTNMI